MKMKDVLMGKDGFVDKYERCIFFVGKHCLVCKMDKWAKRDSCVKWTRGRRWIHGFFTHESIFDL